MKTYRLYLEHGHAVDVTTDIPPPERSTFWDFYSSAGQEWLDRTSVVVRRSSVVAIKLIEPNTFEAF
jgi:hypothetical protein